MKEKWDEIHPEYSFLTNKIEETKLHVLRKTRMLWTLNMYIIDQIIACKLMNQLTLEITVLRLPIIQAVLVMKNHNLI